MLGKRAVSGQEKFAERKKDGDAHVADGVGHGGTDADRARST